MKEDTLNVYKFEKLEVWELSLELSDKVYKISEMLPELERFNLKTQIQRASNSVSLNIAEGSTGLSDKEQIRFLRYAQRSLIETIACSRIMIRKKYFNTTDAEIKSFDILANLLFVKLSAFIKSLK